MPARQGLEDLLHAFRRAAGAAGDAVPERFASTLSESFDFRPIPPRPLPCVRFLPAALAAAAPATRSMAGLVLRHAPTLHWGQTYSAEDLGVDFLDRYGWVELVGTRGHFVSESLAAGFLLLGPHTHYPDHHHQAEEIYIPLTPEAEWRMGGEPFRRRAAGEVVHHDSNVPHAMRTGETPLLALYLWRGGPLAERSVLNGVSP